VGFARESPLCRATFCASTPGSRSFLRTDPARGLNPVPPSWSLTTSTVFSAQGLRACCIPLTTLGFDAFPAGLPGASPGGRPGEAFAFPAPRIVPFEEFPSSAAVPHHCGRCPLDVSARSPRPDCSMWWSSGGSCAFGRSFRFPSLAPARAGAVAGAAPPAAEALGGAARLPRPKLWVVRASSPAEAVVDAGAVRGRSRARLARIASEEVREPVRTTTAGWPSARPRRAWSASRDRSRGGRPPATVVARWRRRTGALPW